VAVPGGCLPPDAHADSLEFILTRVLRIWHVVPRVGLGASTIVCMEARGEFARAVRLASRAKGWIESDIEDWLQSRRRTVDA
jgi:predicted DNA-binding transcriptional regulator AlpA